MALGCLLFLAGFDQDRASEATECREIEDYPNNIDAASTVIVCSFDQAGQEDPFPEGSRNVCECRDVGNGSGQQCCDLMDGGCA